MKKNKREKITASDLTLQAINESLPPTSGQIDSKVRHSFVTSSSLKERSKGRKTIEEAPELGEEQAP